MGKRDYDLIVVGGGSAGSAIAEKINAAGQRVALIERDALGGTCLNYGCDPTKTLLHVAQLQYQAKTAVAYGVVTTAVSLDWLQVQRHMRQVLETIRGGPRPEARAAMRQRGIDLILGEGRFVSAHEVQVGDRVYSAANIVIATGSEAVLPPIEGLAEAGFVTNKEILYLQTLPRRLAIIGGGPIGVEFAQMMTRFGVEVTLVEALAHILPQDEPELANELAQLLIDEGVTIKTGAKLTRVKTAVSGKDLTLQYESGYEETITVDELLIAVGRRQAIETLNLAAAGVTVADEAIVVDEMLRTNVPHIWAAGDVLGGAQFTHVASKQASCLANNILAEAPKPFRAEYIPWVTYTQPELAHVGQTERQLVAAKVQYQVATLPFSNVTRAILTQQTDGQIKLLVGEDGQILGGHILAAQAGELIAVIVLAMQAKVPISQLRSMMLPYPTLAQAISATARQF